MKKAFRDISFIILAILYVVSTMGYAVHECSCDGTAQLQIMCGEAPCEHECDSHGHHHHDDNCCSTDVYVLTQDQDLTDATIITAPESYRMCNFEDILKEPLLGCNFIRNIFLREILPSALKTDIQAEFCTFVI